MAIKLTREALECYILTCLSIQDLYGAQILKNVTSRINVTGTTLYEILNTLESTGKITKRQVVQNGVVCDLCSITPLGKKYLDSLVQL